MGHFIINIIAVAGILLSTLVVYLKLAPKLGLFDTPNERSSHSQVTIRGAGIIYPIALLLYGLMNDFYPISIIVGGILLGILSFIDDWKNLSARFRLGLHALIIGWCLYELNWESNYFWLIPFAVFLYLWLMNAYNFMDGINGITALNTFSVLLALFFLNLMHPFTNSFLLLILLIATVLFSFFNLRTKAICFLGDVGSIPLGFVLIGLTLWAVSAIGDLNPLVFFVVYMIDSGWTIIQRMIAKENILKPHRKHLYQVLANEKQWAHLNVSFLFFLVQMGINVLYFSSHWPKHLFLLITFLVLSLLYLVIKRSLLQSKN